MNYWLTTHWPPSVDEAEADKFNNAAAWVPDGKQSVVKDMEPGDMLFIYESGAGKVAVENRADGTQKNTRAKLASKGSSRWR